MKKIFYRNLRFGVFGVELCGESIVSILLPRPCFSADDLRLPPAAAETFGQLEEYFQGMRRTFDLPLRLEYPTSFGVRILDAMSRIPYGRTESYGALAGRAGFPRAFRAAGSVCARNPLPVVIPCHRVVAANGPGGYGGGIELKKRLLEVEGVLIRI